MRLSRHITLADLSCDCGHCTTHAEDINANLIRQLQKLHDGLGLPLYINSGHRCFSNENTEGARGLMHHLGRAVDISTVHYTPEDKYRLIQLIFRLGTFSGIGIGPESIHLDVRLGDPIVWFYP